MNRTTLRRTSASAALLLAAAAYAQPVVNEDFGVLVNGTPIVRTVNIAPSQILWYKLTLPVALPAGGTNVEYLDIRTHGNGGTITDTEIALYDASGNFASGVAGTSSDDDDGPGLGSSLTYGASCPLRSNRDVPNADGALHNGRDGGLAAGDYYLAVVRFNSTFATPWNPTVPATGTSGPMQLEVSFATAPANEGPILTAAASAPVNPSAGQSALLTATVNASCTGATVANVRVDLSSVGGSATQPMFDDGTNGDAVAGNGIYSYSYAVPGATTPGGYSLPVVVTNSNSLTDTRPIAMTVLGPPATLTPDGSGVYTEIEDNDNKPRANIITAFAPGQSIVGDSTGTSTITAGPASADNFRIKTTPAALGIYRHRISLNSDTNSNTGSLRGLTQTARVVNAGSDAVVQTSSTTATNPTPPRTVQWFGFGKQEEVFYRVTGAASTTAQYVATHTVDPIIPVDAGTIAEGSITIDRATGNTVDVDFLVYDSNFDPIPGYSNDTPNLLTRNFTPGTYYVAWSNANTCNDQPAPGDDTTTGPNVMDFPNVVANSSTTTSANIGIRFNDPTGVPVEIPLTKPGFFDVQWVKFVVQPLTAPTNPRGNGAANPASVQITGSTLLTVTVVGGLNPSSTGLAVTGNLTAINGSSTQQFYDDGTNGDVSAGDNVFSFQANVPEPLSAGGVSLPFTVTDAEARSGTGSIALTLTAAPSGGCCTGGSCAIATAYNCNQGGGTYRGNGSDCGTVSYTISDSPGSFQSISGTGTMTSDTLNTGTSNCDDCTEVLTLPFSFNHFGVDYTDVRVSSNGNLQFGTSNSTAFGNVAIPSTGTPNAAIYPFWDDYDTRNTIDVGQGAVYFQTDGVAPNRTFTVEWNNVTQYRLGAPATYPATNENFQVILHEGSNNIELRYGTVSPVNTTGVNQGTGLDGSGGDCTIGVENATGTTAYSIPSNGFVPGSRLFTYVNEPICTPPCPGNECGTSDYNGDGDFGTDQDIEAFFACLGGQCCATCFCQGSDFNGDGDFGTDQDIEAFFRVLAGGNC
jgi:hypothetical protein